MCEHPVKFNGLCAICGAEIIEHDYDSGLTDGAEKIHILHGSLDLQVSLKEAERVEKGVMERLLVNKRLSLVIDLDQTILHAAQAPGDALQEDWLQEHDDLHKITLNQKQSMYSKPHSYYVKFRPFLRPFLVEASRFFELHVYTMGTRDYARACVKLLDPEGILFYDRILSRDDSVDPTQKNLRRIFPHSDRMVLILDDRGDVWKWCENLVLVRPYRFFGDVVDMNLLHAGSGLRDSLRDADSMRVLVEDEDNQLGHVMSILRMIHSSFFSSSDHLLKGDVKAIVDGMRRSVLDGCTLAFTGLVPTNTDADCAADILALAVAFGAVVDQNVSRSTTHLVCGRPNSGKHRVASALSLAVVRPEWLWESCWRWAQEPLEEYLVEPFVSKVFCEQRDSDEEGEFVDSDTADSTSSTDSMDDSVDDDDDTGQHQSTQKKQRTDLGWLDKHLEELEDL